MAVRIIGGIFFLTLGLFLAWLANRQRLRLAMIEDTATSRIGDLKKRPPGGVVEVKGVVRCETPLSARISQRPCVHYWYRIQEDFQKEWLERSDGNGWNRKTGVVSRDAGSGEKSTEFWLEDPSGRIRVLPIGAEIEGLSVVNDLFEAGSEESWKLSVTARKEERWRNRHSRPDPFGRKRVKVHVGEALSGTRVVEEIVPVDHKVYIIGPVGRVRGEPVIMKGEEDSPFLISVRSEEELVSTARSYFWGYLAGTAVFLLLSVGLFLGLIRAG